MPVLASDPFGQSPICVSLWKKHANTWEINNPYATRVFQLGLLLGDFTPQMVSVLWMIHWLYCFTRCDKRHHSKPSLSQNIQKKFWVEDMGKHGKTWNTPKYRAMYFDWIVLQPPCKLQQKCGQFVLATKLQQHDGIQITSQFLLPTKLPTKNLANQIQPKLGAPPFIGSAHQVHRTATVFVASCLHWLPSQRPSNSVTQTSWCFKRVMTGSTSCDDFAPFRNSPLGIGRSTTNSVTV